MILFNCSHSSSSVLLDINNMNTEVLEINFKNRMLNHPYLMNYVLNVLEPMVLSEDNTLIIIHNLGDAITNLHNLEYEDKHIILKNLFNLINTYTSSVNDRQVAIYRERLVVDSIYSELDKLNNVEIFTDSMKLNKFVSENI